MPIASSDIKFRLSGGASNAVPGASLGGVKSSVDAAGATIFDGVSSAESSTGDVEYRCVYVHNAHATLALDNAVFWAQANTPSATTTLDSGPGTSAVNGTEQTVASESTTPSGVTFIAAAAKVSGVSLGSIPAGQSRAVWIRRTINAGTAAGADTFTFRVEGDTTA